MVGKGEKDRVNESISSSAVNQREKMDIFLESRLGRAILLEVLGIDPYAMADAIGFDLKNVRPVAYLSATNSKVSVKPRFKYRIEFNYAFKLLVKRMNKWFFPRKLIERERIESIPVEKSLGDKQIIILTEMISEAIRDRQHELENIVSDPVALLHRVGLVIEHYPWAPSWYEFPNMLASVKNALTPVAEIITHSSLINWWWSPMAQTSQRWLGVGQRKLPNSDELVSALSNISEQIELSHWWIAPINDHIPRTTRGPIGSSPSVSLLCLSDPEQMHLENLSVWQVQTPAKANIYEVRGANDWVALVERFPRDLAVAFNRDWSRWTGQAGPWLLPDWKAISENYDGVHISIAGFIAAAYQALPVRDGFTILTGWRLDETLWLGKTPTAIQQLA